MCGTKWGWQNCGKSAIYQAFMQVTSVAPFEVSKEMNFYICFYWILMGSHLLMSERGWDWDIIELSLDSTGDNVVSFLLPMLIPAGLSSDQNSKHYGFKSDYMYCKWPKKNVEWSPEWDTMMYSSKTFWLRSCLLPNIKWEPTILNDFFEVI